VAEVENNKPSIRIHIDQQVTIDAVRGAEEVEDVTVATDITGFDVEGDSYILKGALTLSGFLRQSTEGEELPDELDDQDVFAAEEAAEAHLIPVHQRLPFVVQVPVAAQQAHQRETGILNVNPKVGQWNLHVLGEKTLHLRCELILQGLSGNEGYVFRCGTQEEGVAATRLDQLLEEDVPSFLPPTAQVEEEFVPPFETVWRAEEDSIENEADNVAEDDWVIETPAAMRTEHDEEEEAEREIVFTPDPAFQFPLPDPSSDWVKQLESTDRMFNDISTPGNPINPGNYYTAPQQNTPFEHQQHEEAELPAAVTPWRAEEPVEFDPYAQVRGQFQTNDVNIFEAERSEFVPNQPIDLQPNAPLAEELINQWQAPTQDQVSDFTASWQQQPAPESVVNGQVTDLVGEGRADDDEDAFIVEPQEPQAEVREEREAAPEAEAVQEEAAPAEPAVELTEAPAEEVVAEFTFEDEVQRPDSTELDVTPEPTPLVEKVAAATGPKISFTGKQREEIVEPPVKLSAIFGDSREPAALSRESSPHHAYQESSSHHHHESGSHKTYETVAVKPMTKDSIWGGMLAAAKESKVTMKFHIVQVEENLPGLAERYDLSISDLLRANNMQNQEIDLGQILYIPTRR